MEHKVIGKVIGSKINLIALDSHTDTRREPVSILSTYSLSYTEKMKKLLRQRLASMKTTSMMKTFKISFKFTMKSKWD